MWMQQSFSIFTKIDVLQADLLLTVKKSSDEIRASFHPSDPLSTS